MMVIILSLFITLLVSGKNAELTLEDAKDYLENYGYLSRGLNSSLTSISDAIVEFQEKFSLTTDGTLNEETEKLMSAPRCGRRDDQADYSVANPTQIKWNKSDISWKIIPPTYDINTYRYLADRAFKNWEKYTNLRFIYSHLNADITITFNENNHTYNGVRNLSCFFQGSGVVAHADYPYKPELEIHVNKNIKFDLSARPKPGEISLLQTLTHEIGHTLGISHSSDRNAIMYPILNTNRKTTEVSQDDIFAIQFLYGYKSSSTTTSTTFTSLTTKKITTTEKSIPVEEEIPKLCDLNFKKINTFIVVNGKLYIFYKNYVWIKDLKSNITTSFPLKIKDFLKFLPDDFSSISAIYQRPIGDIAIFIDSNIYFINFPSFALTQQKSISDIQGFHKETKINGIVNTYSGQTFLFYDQIYYAEISECNFSSIRYGLLSDKFPGVPTNFNSVFRYINGLLYFFTSENIFYEYDEFSNTIKKTGKTSLSLFDISCPSPNLLEQIKILLRSVVNKME